MYCAHREYQSAFLTGAKCKVQTVLVKQETEYQLIELCCSVSLFLVLWSNFHRMKTIRQEGVRLRGVQYKPNRMGGRGRGWIEVIRQEAFI